MMLILMDPHSQWATAVSAHLLARVPLGVPEHAYLLALESARLSNVREDEIHGNLFTGVLDIVVDHDDASTGACDAGELRNDDCHLEAVVLDEPHDVVVREFGTALTQCAQDFPEGVL